MINRYHKTDSAKSSTPLETQARQALNPARRSADLKSAVKKGHNLLRICRFEIRSKQEWNAR